MRTLEIVFTKSKKKFPIGSWLIRLWTWKSYSHVARMTTLKTDINLYYQANDNKVNYEVEEVFFKKHKIVKRYRLKVDTKSLNEISRACLLNCGKKYGFWQNIGIAIYDISKLLGFKIKPLFKDGQNCSELIYEKVLKNILPDLRYDKDLIKPHHVERIILNYFKHDEVNNIYILKTEAASEH